MFQPRLLGVLLSIVFCCASLVSYFASASSDFSFGGESSYVDENGVYHLYGEIQNNSPRPMSSIIIDAEFDDGQGHIIGNSSGEPSLHTLNPGAKSSFEVLFLNSTLSHKLGHYSLLAVGKPGQEKTGALVIASSNSRLDLLGTYYINAVVTNNAPENATNTEMIATLYDSNGNVIALGTALAEAEPGSSDVLPGQQAAFGIAVTDRLQTYKTAWYTLVSESDQFISNQVLLTPKNSSYGAPLPGSNPKSGCLIATAAYGDALAPQVQELRTFRDSIVVSTVSGSSFMDAFNAWYYSFSPGVADVERHDPLLQSLVRAAILPLLSILRASTSIHGELHSDPELAIVGTGVFASGAIGIAYLGPLMCLVAVLTRRKRIPMGKIAVFGVLSFLGTLGSVAVSLALNIPFLGSVATSVLVLSTIGGTGLFILWIVRSRIVLRPLK